jgi:hypothetical protein
MDTSILDKPAASIFKVQQWLLQTLVPMTASQKTLTIKRTSNLTPYTGK